MYPVGTKIYFLKGYRGQPANNCVIKPEGTCYFDNNFPKDTGIPVVVGQVTQRRGEISLAYYSLFLTFKKVDMWGSDSAPNKQRAQRMSPLESTVKIESRGTLAFDGTDEARRAYSILQDNNLECSLDGNRITGIKRPSMVKIVLEREMNSSKVAKRGLLTKVDDLDIFDNDEEDIKDIIL